IAFAGGNRLPGRRAISGYEDVVAGELLEPRSAIHLPHGIEMRERRTRTRRVRDRDAVLPLGLAELLPGDRHALLLDQRGVVHWRYTGRTQRHPSRTGVVEALSVFLGYRGRGEPLVEPSLLPKIFESAGVRPVDEIGADPSSLAFRDESPYRLNR